MIQARLISGGAELYASFYHENSNIEVAYQKVINQEDAQRLVDFHNRNFLASTIINWLKQRNYVLHLGAGQHADKSEYLLATMKVMRLASYRVVVKFIRDNAKLFGFCIPPEKSVQYNYYEKEIKPLLDFCNGNN